MNLQEISKTFSEAAREIALASVLSSAWPSQEYIAQEMSWCGHVSMYPKIPGAGYSTPSVIWVQPALDQQGAYAILESRALEQQRHEAQCSFNKLAYQWQHETQSAPSARAIAMHPAYQKIMVMGKTALPFILHDLEHHATHWFWALSYIADENPVPPESRGKVREMAQAWTDWGRRNGYI